MATRKRKTLIGEPAPAEAPKLETAAHPVDGMTPDRMPVDVPVLYADQITDIIYGIHTSKLVLGLENGRGPSRPVAMVIIPTAALVVAAGGFLDTMGSAGMISETSERLAGMVDMLTRLSAITQRKV